MHFTLSIIFYNNFKCYRNLINELSRVSNAKHYHHYFTDYKRGMLKTCERIKSLININKKDKNKLMHFTLSMEKLK